MTANYVAQYTDQNGKEHFETFEMIDDADGWLETIARKHDGQIIEDTGQACCYKINGHLVVIDVRGEYMDYNGETTETHGWVIDIQKNEVGS